MDIIESVRFNQLKDMHDERDWLMEALRDDDILFVKFGQAYLTTAYLGVVKPWNYHKKQIDYFVFVTGMVQLILYDDRMNSSTKGTVKEFFMGNHN